MSGDNESGPDLPGMAKGTVQVAAELMKAAGDNPDVRDAGTELGKAALTVAKTINV